MAILIFKIHIRFIVLFYFFLSSSSSASGMILLKNNQILLVLADFALQEQPEDNLIFILGRGIMTHIPWPLSQSNPWNCII